jgi:prepilin-type N-terminal cleavage/methylation domain-containing protein
VVIPSSGFSLVELLVVIALICLLAALLFPLMTEVRNTSLKLMCAHNLRQVGLVCNAFAEDHGGALPQANTQNPTTLRFGVCQQFNRYMVDLGIKPDIWYCPALKFKYRDPSSWLQHIPHWNWGWGEVPLGYIYVGNPDVPDCGKFVKPYPTMINDYSADMELIFDYCAVLRPCPDEGRNINDWYAFPHYGKGRPEGSTVLMGDLHLEYRRAFDLSVGYRFFHPQNLFW